MSSFVDQLIGDVSCTVDSTTSNNPILSLTSSILDGGLGIHSSIGVRPDDTQDQVHVIGGAPSDLFERSSNHPPMSFEVEAFFLLRPE